MEVFNDTISDDKNTINSDILKLKRLRKRLLNISKLFNDYTLSNKSRIDDLVKEVNSFSHDYKKMSNDKFRQYAQNKTKEYKDKLRNGNSLESIMCEALSIVREAIRKTKGIYPYDTQIEACIALLGTQNSDYEKNRVLCQMSNSEGKKVVEVLLAYLYLLDATKDEVKKSVHIVNYSNVASLNDMQNYKEVYEMLGFTCGFVKSRGKDLDIDSRTCEYDKDVVYSDYATIALDYLDDNTVLSKDLKYIKKPFGYLIINNADIILLDESINPFKLIGSLYGKDEELNYYLSKKKKEEIDLYRWATNYVYGDDNTALTYIVYDEFYEANNDMFTQEYAYIKDTNNIIFSKRLKDRLEKMCALDQEEYNLKYQALVNVIKARHAFINKKEYTINYDNETKEGVVTFIDKRLNNDKSFREIKIAIEAKEEYYHKLLNNKYTIKYSDDEELKAICTYSDFLSMYSLGISAIASNSSLELKELYGFETYKIERRKKNIRLDEEYLYATKDSKYKEIINRVKIANKKGQPVLISTSNIDEFNMIDSLLSSKKINHISINGNNELLNDKLISSSALYGNVTLVNNMGSFARSIKTQEGINELGGLLLISVSKKNSKRLDDDFKELTASQADRGTTISYSSLEDDIVKEYYTDSNGISKIDILIKEYDNDKPIENKKIKDIVYKAQEYKENKDKKLRSINNQFNIVHHSNRLVFYKERDNIMYSSSLELCKLTENIISEYANIVANKYDKETAQKLLGHLINIDTCYDSDKVIFKEMIKNELIDLFKNKMLARLEQTKIDVFKKAKANGYSKEDIVRFINKEYDKIIESLRKKYLHIMDIYYIKYISELDNIRISNSINNSTSPLEDYKLEVSNEFYNNMFPNIYNEMITYALNLDYKFGDYKKNTFSNHTFEKIVL